MQSKSRFVLSVVLWSFVITFSVAIMFGWLALDWAKGVILFLAFLSAVSASLEPRPRSVTPIPPTGPPNVPAPPKQEN